MTETPPIVVPPTVATGVNEVVFTTPILMIGKFRCPASHALFRNSGPTTNYCFVFPRTAVGIQHDGRRAFAADPTVVTYYNPGQVYTRHVLAASGDRCDWFAVTPDVLRDAIAEFDPASADAEWRLFRDSHGPSDRRSYVLQRLVFDHASNEHHPDALFVEETMLHVLDRLLEEAYGCQARSPSSPHRDRPADLTEVVRGLVARSFQHKLSLQSLASSAGVSVFHLCRTFRRATGTSIHAYQVELRLRSSLELVMDARADLLEVALALGFSSHAHFTAAFHRAFGLTPSALRLAGNHRLAGALTSRLGAH